MSVLSSCCILTIYSEQAVCVLIGTVPAIQYTGTKLRTH